MACWGFEHQFEVAAVSMCEIHRNSDLAPQPSTINLKLADDSSRTIVRDMYSGLGNPLGLPALESQGQVPMLQCPHISCRQVRHA